MPDGRPSDPTIKTLFAYSGNVCAFRDSEGPACEERLTDPGWKSVKARICHIAGRRPESARYDITMTDEERAHFDNLILMCPTHHVRIDELEPDRFSVDLLREMKAKALEANGGPRGWATDLQLDRFVALASVVMQRQYAAEEAPISSVATDPAQAVTGVLSTNIVASSGVGADISADRGGRYGFAGTTGFANRDAEDQGRYATQVRQILGYDNVLSVDDSAEPGRIDVATNWLPTDLDFDKLGQFGTANGLNIVVTSQGERRHVP